MLSFHTYITEIFLMEATAKHFGHLGLDAANPEHKDLIDAYNAGRSANDPNVPSHPGQIKSIDQLHSAVRPHLEKIQQKHQEAADDRNAYGRGEARELHHNPETGAKVTAVSSQPGSCAANPSSTWCTANRAKGVEMVRHYDPKGDHSFIFHFPQEKKKHLRTIGAYGQYSGDKGRTANFQDAENRTVHEDDWNRLTKEHGLDKIKHLKGVVRNIGITPEEKDQYAGELTHSIKSGKVSDQDISHARATGYLSQKHKDALVNNKKTSGNVLNILASDHSLHKAILNHPNTDDRALSQMALHTTDDNNIKAIVDHPKVGDSTLAKIYGHNSDLETRKKIMDHPNIGSDTLHAMAIHRDSGDKEYNKIINHSMADPAALGAVAIQTHDPEIHKGILRHPNVDAQVLQTMARQRKPEVHKAILDHPKVDDRTIGNLVLYGSHPYTMDSIMTHPKAGDITLSALAKKSNDPDTHKAIMNHPLAGVRALTEIAKDSKDPEIQRAVMNHPKTDDTVLTSLLYRDHNNNKHLHKELLTHPKTGPHTLHTIASDSNDPEIHRAILNHPKVDDEVLSKLAEFSASSKVHKAIMNHPKTDSESLLTIAQYSEDPEIHKAILNHPKVDNNAINTVAANTEDHGVQKAIVNHPKTDSESLYEIGRNSDDPELHKAILNHPNNTSYNISDSIKKIHDPKVHSLMVKHFASHIEHRHAEAIAKKYNIGLPPAPSYGSWHIAEPHVLANLKQGLSKITGRSDAKIARASAMTAQEEHIVSPIKNRQRRHNFTEEKRRAFREYMESFQK